MGLETIAKILLRIALLSMVLLGLNQLGKAVNFLIPWQYIEMVFILMRKFVLTFDFIIYTAHLWTAFGYVLALYSVVLIYKATMAVVRFFNEQ